MEIILLKEMGRTKSNTVKKGNGKNIRCSKCGEKIFYETEEARENIIKYDGKRFYVCGCDNEILLK